MSDPWAHLERNFEAHMDRDRSERDAHLAADEPPPPSPRCDRTRDMFDESRLMDAQLRAIALTNTAPACVEERVAA